MASVLVCNHAQPSHPFSPEFLTLPVSVLVWPHFHTLFMCETSPTHFPRTRHFKPVSYHFTTLKLPSYSFSVLQNCCFLSETLFLAPPPLRPATAPPEDFPGIYFRRGSVLIAGYFTWATTTVASWWWILPLQSFSPPQFLEPWFTKNTGWCPVCCKSPNTSYCLESKLSAQLVKHSVHVTEYLSTN